MDYSEPLYNITGSTHDPEEIPDHEGSNWKQLLIDLAGMDAETPCYVTNPIPDGPSSHPEFALGGHMTPNENGEVPLGGICYLMPLCHWHNHTSRNGVAFEHTETKMLKLNGFMEGDSPITFRLQEPSSDPFALLFFDDESSDWRFTNLATDDPSEIEAATIRAPKKQEALSLLLERAGDSLYVRDTNLRR